MYLYSQWIQYDVATIQKRFWDSLEITVLTML